MYISKCPFICFTYWNPIQDFVFNKSLAQQKKLENGIRVKQVLN